MRCAVSLFFDFYRNFLIKIKVFRIFNTYGTKIKINNELVISNFINQALC